MSTGILLLDQGTAGIAKFHGLSLNPTHWTQFCQTHQSSMPQAEMAAINQHSVHSPTP